jgi:hypothetical protein
MSSNLPRRKRRKSKVVPIDQQESISPSRPKVVATDDVTKRIIIGIGGQRLAYDFTTTITKLPPNTGDQPAPVVPLKKRKGMSVSADSHPAA